jgi:hypothetical protein
MNTAGLERRPRLDLCGGGDGVGSSVVCPLTVMRVSRASSPLR